MNVSFFNIQIILHITLTKTLYLPLEWVRFFPILIISNILSLILISCLFNKLVSSISVHFVNSSNAHPIYINLKVKRVFYFRILPLNSDYANWATETVWLICHMTIKNGIHQIIHGYFPDRIILKNQHIGIIPVCAWS